MKIKKNGSIEIQPIEIQPIITKKIILTIDLEPWCNDSSYEDGTEWILNILDKNNSKATFFVLGNLAKKSPSLILEINKRGHEIGSHSWCHKSIHDLNPEAFREDTLKSIEEISNLIGKQIRSYRAPIFSINNKTFWALDVLIKCGIYFDSSIFPIYNRRYGIYNFPRKPSRIHFNNNRSIIEIPLSTVNINSINYPVSGGGYFRLMPWMLINWSIKRVINEGLPFITYCHPYELEKKKLLLKKNPKYGFWGSRKREFRFNLLRASMRNKIENIIAEYNSQTIKEALSGYE